MSSYSKELQQHLSGRLLLASEIPYEIDQHPNVASMKGVRQEKGRYVCERCGNQDPTLFYTFPCQLCHQDCMYCRSCIMMGRVSECARLYYWTGPNMEWEIPDLILAWEGALSDGQRLAAESVVEAVTKQEEFLVWAVCGAGKTEVLFPGIEAGLREGKRICIATPRTDVVLELAPRLQKAFPSINVAALYGGSEDRHTFSPLTVSTTHQLFRFSQAFDVIIIDEVDAFPYSIDESLKYAVQKAKKPLAATIYLTATPSKQMKRSFQHGKLKAVTIPARFHRRPIPVPEMKWCGNWKKPFQKKKIPDGITRWVTDRLENRTPFLLFFPSIQVMEQALPLFQELESKLEAVHSEHPLRKERVLSLRKGEVPGLLTTTILERGVTIEKLDAAVIGAEHEVFSESALVQIAGRVGRSAAHPTGTVTFFHYGKSQAMTEAVRHIRMMNREAQKRGLLDA